MSSVLGPGVGGAVVAKSNANYAFLVDGVCFALCGPCILWVTQLSLVLCGALAQHHTGLMFGGTAAILALPATGVLCSRPVRQMR